VREGDLSCTESNVQPGDVAQESNKNGLECETKVGVHVDHTLLRDRKSTSLADHEVGPLHAHNRNKVTSLSVFESFGGPADLGLTDI